MHGRTRSRVHPNSAAMSTGPITGLDVSYGQDETKHGYTKIDIDLHGETRTDTTFICYSTTESGPPITNIQVFASKCEDFIIQDGYERIPKSLNKEGGRYIYLCYTRSTCFKPITAVNVIRDSNREVYPESVEWIRIDQNCSEGSSGHFSYVVYKR